MRILVSKTMYKEYQSLIYFVLSVLFLEACQNSADIVSVKADQILNTEVEKAETRVTYNAENDSVIMIPLDQVYGKDVQNMILNSEYNESSAKMVMSFCLLGDRIFLANNDKQVFQVYNLNDKKLTKVFDYPLMPDYENPLTRSFIKDNVIYCTGYGNTYELNASTGQPISISNPSFGKNKFETIPIFSKNRFEGLIDFPKNVNLLIEGAGFDFVFFEPTNSIHGVLINGESINIIVNQEFKDGSKSTLFDNINLANYQANDIVYDDGKKLLFVLKSNITDIEDDLLITYDFVKDILTSCRRLKSHIPNIRSQLGDPICFPTGTVYQLSDDNILWRLRTTGKGVVLENWGVGNVLD